jgi:hypothetical protein
MERENLTLALRCAAANWRFQLLAVVQGPRMIKSRMISNDHLLPSASSAELMGKTERQSSCSMLFGAACTPVASQYVA